MLCAKIYSVKIRKDETIYAVMTLRLEISISQKETIFKEINKFFFLLAMSDEIFVN